MEIQNNIQKLIKLKELLNDAKNRFIADPKLKRVAIFTSAAFGLILFALIVAIGTNMLGKGGQKATATPSPVVSALPFSILNPSRYATDSGVISLDASIKKVNQEMGALTVPEYNLRPPSLDFDINFSQQ